MIPRILEPEIMDTAEEAVDYDAMDHSEVNRLFVDDLLALWNDLTAKVLDVGTGTALIPIELSRRGFSGRITSIDLAEEMLAVGRQNTRVAGAANVTLERVDAKSLPYDEGTFDVVMSNSIVHHIPDPVLVLSEMRRVLRPEGLLFVRDLLRPESSDEVERLVGVYTRQETSRQQQLFRQSLHASLTLAEVRAVLASVGLDQTALSQSSDRHWTIAWRCH